MDEKKRKKEIGNIRGRKWVTHRKCGHTASVRNSVRP